jgi:succinoglycan biosynthesis transport protein ExoP
MERVAQETDVRGLLLILWRRRLVIFGVLLLGLGFSGLALGLTKPHFTARAIILVNTGARDIIPREIVPQASSRYDASLVLNEVEIIRSRSMASSVIERLGLKSDAEFSHEDVVSAFGRKLAVRPVPGSYAIQLEFNSLDAEKAAKVANAIADSYVEKSLESSFAASQKLAAWLNKRSASLRAEVQAQELAVERYKEANNIRQDTTTLLSGEQVRSLNEQLAKARGEQAAADAKLQQVKAMLESPSRMESSGAVMNSEVIQKLKIDQARLEAEMAELSSRYGPKHPQILNLQSEIAGTRDSIRAEIATIAKGIGAEMDLAAGRVSALEQSLDVSGGVKMREDSRMVGLRALEMEAESTRETLNGFMEAARRGERQEELQEPRAKVISHASVPRAPSWPNQMLVLSLSAVASLFAGLAIALLMEKMDNSFRSANQIEKAMGLPCFALIPSAGKVRMPFLGRYPLAEPTSGLAESVRTLRMVMNLRSGEKKPKVVTMTSSFPAEGKTTLSLWLARSAAASGEKVVLVDTDLRRPNVHKSSGQKGPANLAQYLSGEKQLNEVICKDADSPAHIIFGSSVPNALDLLGTERMKELVEHLRGMYDLVILDSPSCLAVPDARLLATLSDCVLYAVKWDKTPREAVAGGVKHFTDFGYSALALVLTNVDVKKHAEYGYGDSAAYYGTYANYMKKAA